MAIPTADASDHRRSNPVGEKLILSQALSRIKLVDVVLPRRDGTEIRRRCVTRPNDHQAILLQRLGMNLPSHLPATDENVNEM